MQKTVVVSNLSVSHWFLCSNVGYFWVLMIGHEKDSDKY